MKIDIDTDILIEYGFTISEYLYLYYLYMGETSPEMYKIIDHVDEIALQKKGYIKIGKSDITLRTLGIKVFEKDNLFITFLNTFPIHSPSGRYLSPVGQSGKIVDKVKARYDANYKNKPHLAEKALKVLEAELEWRKRTNSLEYIHNIETWLYQRDDEKFEYLLNDSRNNNNNDEDMM